MAISRPDQLTVRLGVFETDLRSPRPPTNFLKRRKAPCSSVAAAIVALTALGVSMAACQSAKELSETAPVLVQLTSDPGDEAQPSFSVDGNQVAFVWRKEKEDNYDIYIKTLQAEKVQQLTSDPADDYSPAWSPDGRWIAFLRDFGTGKTAVLLAPSAGEPARKLAEVSSGAIHSGLAWHPNGKHLVISHQNSPDEPASLFLLSVATGETRRLTRPSGGSVLADGEPAVSPDGHHIVFLRLLDTALGDLYLLELSGDLEPKGEPQPLTAKNELATGPVWASDGQEIIFTLTTGAYRSGLWRISASGGEPKRLAFGGENGVSAAISPSGHQLVFAEPRRDADIWRLELGGHPRPAVRITSSPRWETHAQYSPDGRKIAFRSDRSGTSEIWVSDHDGAHPVKVTSFGGPATGQPTWSPDGRTLAFVSRPEENADIYVIGLEGGQPRRITTHPSGDIRPSWAPDGEWLYFLSFRSGDGEIWKAPLEEGELVQITDGGALQPVPSPDGGLLYYSRLISGVVSLWKVSVAGGQAVQVVDSLLNRGSFAVTHRGVYFVQTPDAKGTHSLQLLDSASGEIRRIATLPAADFLRFSVAPSGRYLLYRLVYEATSDLMLVENFQ